MFSGGSLCVFASLNLHFFFNCQILNKLATSWWRKEPVYCNFTSFRKKEFIDWKNNLLSDLPGGIQFWLDVIDTKYGCRKEILCLGFAAVKRKGNLTFPIIHFTTYFRWIRFSICWYYLSYLLPNVWMCFFIL